MMDKIYEIICGKETELKQKLFRCIAIIGILMTALGCIESIFIDGVGQIFITVIVLLVAMILSIFLTFKFNKAEVVSICIVGIVDFIVFPEMFRMGGGIVGSGCAWFACGLIYVFFITKGKNTLFLAITVIIMDGAMYLYSYNNPDKISGHSSKLITHIDGFFSEVLIGLAIGAIVLFMKEIYERERKTVLEQKKKIEMISESRNMFYTSMSHELRTPITTIIGSNELIERSDNLEEIMEYTQNIKQAGSMLLSLVNDIIDMSKIEQNKMDIVETEYNVKKMFVELVDMVRVQAKKKDLELNVDIDGSIPSILYGDEKRIKQVILNLLINAIKYTNSGSIWLDVRKEKDDGDRVSLKISVKDTGVGIKKENLKEIFDTLTRVNEKENYNIEGSGLGLAICKQLVERMGGNISVDSVYQKGSTFTIYIEQDIIDSTPASEVKDNITFERKNTYKESFICPEGKILIVDDNIINAQIIKKLLEKTQMHVDIVTESKECLDITKKRIYNIIILDYLLPDISGGELLKLIKNQENGLCKKSSFLVATAVGSAEIKKIMDDYFFDGYLEKPINPKILEETICNLLPREIIEYSEKEVMINEKIFDSRRKKKKKICITTDSMCAISKHDRDKYDIKVMYSYVSTGVGRIADMGEVDAEGVLTCFSSLTPDSARRMQISGITVEEYEQFFAETLMDADDIIHISVAGFTNKRRSTSFKGIAEEAAKSFDHVDVIDSGCISAGQGLLTLQAARMVLKGYDKDEIIRKINDQKEVMISKMFSYNVTQLAMAGQIPKAMYKRRFKGEYVAMFEMKKKKIRITALERGDRKKAMRKYIRKMFINDKVVDRGTLYISHTGYTIEEIEYFKNEIERYIRFSNVIVQKGSMSVACSVGVGTIEFAYITKYKDVEDDLYAV